MLGHFPKLAYLSQHWYVLLHDSYVNFNENKVFTWCKSFTLLGPIRGYVSAEVISVSLFFPDQVSQLQADSQPRLRTQSIFFFSFFSIELQLVKNLECCRLCLALEPYLEVLRQYQILSLHHNGFPKIIHLNALPQWIIYFTFRGSWIHCSSRHCHSKLLSHIWCHRLSRPLATFTACCKSYSPGLWVRSSHKLRTSLTILPCDSISVCNTC